MGAMRIGLIGDYAENLDEGMKNLAFHLTYELSKRHQVLPLNIKKIFFRSFWRDIKKFNPQIIHYVHGPSVKSFIIVKAIAFYCGDTKTVMSATHPTPFSFSKKIIPLLKPDLILTQSYETEKMFINLGCKTEFLPNGINTKRFVPVSEDNKDKLREKYGLDKGKFIILHVGSVRQRRNIQVLNRIQRKENNQVLIVGSTSTLMEQGVYKSLIENGCIVWRTYCESIEEIYALSDCYVFPVINKLGSVEMPLSVLEAMSCNLPVISTKFGALSRVFKEGDGLTFVDNEEGFIGEWEKSKNTDVKIKTREKVLPYSWENVGKNLDKLYTEVVNGKIL